MSQHPMTDVLRSADGGPAEPGHGDIVRRGRRLTAYRTAGRLAGAAVAVAALAGAAVLLMDVPSPRAPVIGEPPSDEAVPKEPTPGDRPSQSEADAQRDGIHPEIAARSFTDRVDVEHSGTGSGTPRLVTDEGVWVVSRIPADTIRNDEEDEQWPLVGDRSGLYGRDVIDLTGYGEVLLLDHQETRILRAFPFPDFPPGSLVAMDDAVYCARQGDGGRPDSMLCRIDRGTFASSARLFPWSGDDLWFLDPEEYHLPGTWTVDDARGEVLFQELRLVGDDLVTVGQDGQRRVDPFTLELTDETEPTVTSSAVSLVEGFLDFASAPSPEAAMAAGFADEVSLGLGAVLHTTATKDELVDPGAWVIDVPDFRGHVGPFSALELSAAADDIVVRVGPHAHCASSAMPAPPDLEGAWRISFQPDAESIDSCLRWWTVDLFIDENDAISAVTMDLWEP